MALYTFKPVANGLSTDHPIPDLPFVDDSYLPTAAEEIEAVGRISGGDTWGRQDRVGDGGWTAFTTDPERKELAWFVRFHPLHGRSVILLHDDDASSMHMAHTHEMPTALVFRSGGYWWDGAEWFRPGQVWDRAGQRYVVRRVPGATTVFADAANVGDAARGRIGSVAELDLEAPAASERWEDDLALWAARRDGGLPLSECVVRLSAPELVGDQLIGTGKLAELSGISASTLRAYIVRGEAEVPLPQAVIGGRNAWSRPVGQDWVEQRAQSWDSVTDAVSVDRNGVAVPVGMSELWSRFTDIMFSRLWTAAGMRQRWALRWRSEAQVRRIAENLGWSVAVELDNIVPVEELAFTIVHAVLDEIAVGHRFGDAVAAGDFYGINFRIAKMLDWLVRHEPGQATAAIASIIREAEDRFGVARETAINTITTALSLDGLLAEETLEGYLKRALPTAE